MADTSMQIARRPPLADGAAALTAGIDPDVLEVRVLPPRARFALRVDPALLPAGGEVAGFVLGMAINRWGDCARGRVLRLGPDEWLLWAAEGESGRIAADVSAALAGRHFSLVDVSHGRAAFGVSGAEAASLLNSGCPLDLSPAAFPAGTATRTLIGKCEVVLARADELPTGDRPAFEVECGRSFASYLRDFLLEAARELRSRS
jgi:sarcosine oxidase subunit gamma